MKTHLIILFSVLIFFSSAQTANIWHFGSNGGLNFNTNPPSPLNSGQIVGPDNSSTISDCNGNLLFYTDGTTVWNKNHIVMPNGSGLIGHTSGGQCALIVPIPSNPDKYVIFHVTEFANPGFLNYSVVDMTLNGGFGDVVVGQKNVSLGSGWTEKLCAYYNSAGNNYWVVTHKWNSADFVAFNVNAITIATQSVVSTVGSVHSCGTFGGLHDAMGQLTISKDGTKLVNALTCQNKYELFNFNSVTGAVSGAISISGAGNGAWGTAISPDGTKLYVNSIFGQSVYQYNVSVLNQVIIANSINTLTTTGQPGYNFGYMELGPDNKIYIAKPGSNFFSVVHNPNSLGAACNFQQNGQSLGNNFSAHGISRIAYNIPAGNISPTININSNTGSFSICPGQTITLSASGGNSYSWSNGINSPSITVSPSVTTIYSVQTTANCNQAGGSASVTVNVNPAVISVSGFTSICQGQTTTLSANGFNVYNWSNGSTASSIIVSPTTSTTYTVIGTNSLTSCSANTAIAIVVSNSLNINVSGNLLLCLTGNPSTTLTASAAGANSYTWSTNANGSVIAVSPNVTTTYTITGIDNQTKCGGKAVVTVTVSECLGFKEAQGTAEQIVIWPNPTTGNFTLFFESKESTKGVVSVFDISGREVLAQDIYLLIGENSLLVSTTTLQNGIYFTQIKVADQVYTKKLVVSK